MAVIVPAAPDVIIISVEYAPNGLHWARLYDNVCLGWVVEEAFPKAQWAKFIGPVGPAIMVPDLWRGSI